MVVCNMMELKKIRDFIGLDGSNKKIKVLIFLASFLITTALVIVFFRGEDIHTDSSYYMAGARSLASSGKYLEDDKPAKYPIGTSLLVSIPLFFKLPAMAVYLLFAYLTLLVIYKLARVYMDEKYALLSILFFSSNPSFVLFSGTYTSELFSIFFVTYIVYLFVKNKESPRIGNFIWLGVVSGFATLIHYTNGIFFLTVVFLLLRKRRIKQVFVISIFFISMMIPQLLYNAYYYKNITGGYDVTTGYTKSGDTDTFNPVYMVIGRNYDPFILKAIYHILTFDWMLVFFTVYGVIQNFKNNKKNLYYFPIASALVWAMYSDIKRRNLFPLFGIVMIPTMFGLKELTDNIKNKWLVFPVFLISILVIHINIMSRCIGF